MAAAVVTCSFGFSLEVSLRTTNSDNTLTDTLKSGSTLFPGWSLALVDGTGALKVQKHYHQALTINATSSTTINLAAVVTESFGTIAFTVVKTLVIRLRGHVTGHKVVVGNAGASPWAPFLSAATTTIDVADLLVLDAPDDGWAAGSPANLKIANPGASAVVVDLSITGN